MGLFGKKPTHIPGPTYQPPPSRAPAGPGPDQALHNMEMRTGNLQARISQIEVELAGYKKEMARSKQGSATHNMNKRRAMQAIKQRKQLESRLAATMNNSFNIESMRDAKHMQQDNLEMVQTMKGTASELRAAQGQIDIDQVEDLQDDITDAMDEINEVQGILGRSYEVDPIDDADLEAELEGIDETFEYGVGQNLATPSYLQPAPYNTPATGMPAGMQANPSQQYAPSEQMPASRY